METVFFSCTLSFMVPVGKEKIFNKIVLWVYLESM